MTRPAHRPARWSRPVAAGVTIAVAGHVPSSGLLLWSMFTFTFYATPDTVFMVVCMVAVLHLVLCVLCVGVGYPLYRGRHRDFGLGLLAGWACGWIALVSGVVWIAMAAFISPSA